MPDTGEVVVFFSGHGARSGETDEDFLVPQDGNPDDIPGTCISYTAFRQKLQTKRPARALLLVDACRDLTGKAATNGFGTTPQRLAPQFAELFSCEPTEISREGKAEDFQEGVFTHYLVQGLQGDPEAAADGKITYDSLKRYVQGHVSQYMAHAFGATQVPDGDASEGDMVLAVAPSEGAGGGVTGSLHDLLFRSNLPTSGIPDPPITAVNPVDGAEMICIPPGEFTMGSTDSEAEAAFQETVAKFKGPPRDWSRAETPQQRVYLDGYWIYKTPVTVAQYQKFCQAAGRQMPPEPTGGDAWHWGDHPEGPILNVTWEDAQAYCAWAGASLPTEAQWEKAARGTDGRKFPWGSEFDNSRLWCSVQQQRQSTTAVGSCPSGAGPYGVLDMAGNVWQWCADWYDQNYYRNLPARNPTGPAAGGDRVLRGGSWSDSGATGYFRCANRGNGDPTYWYNNIGFRCVIRAGAP